MNEILLFLLGGLVGTLAPAPFDFLHFMLQNHLYNSKASRSWFEFLQIIDWYLVDSIYFMILIAVYYIFGLSNTTNVQSWTTILSILGVGAVIGIISAFIFHKRKR